MQADVVINFIVFSVIWVLPLLFIVLIYLGMRRDKPPQSETSRTDRANVLPFRRRNPGPPADA